MFMGVAFASCEKDEVGGTATEALAGEWYVTVSAVDDNGATVLEDDDLFELGNIFVLTYNTAANVATEMYVSDLGYLEDFPFTVRTSCDVNSLTFSTNGSVANEATVKNVLIGNSVTIEDGKILSGAATTPSGMPADSIVFYVSFSDDPYPAAYGYAKYKVSGYRYTGFTADD